VDGEIVEMFGFDTRGRFDLPETPSAIWEAFEYIGSHQDAIEGERRLEYG
jgi:hypothetical protein